MKSLCHAHSCWGSRCAAAGRDGDPGRPGPLQGPGGHVPTGAPHPACMRHLIMHAPPDHASAAWFIRPRCETCCAVAAQSVLATFPGLPPVKSYDGTDLKSLPGAHVAIAHPCSCARSYHADKPVLCCFADGIVRETRARAGERRQVRPGHPPRPVQRHHPHGRAPARRWLHGPAACERHVDKAGRPKAFRQLVV